MLSDIFRSAGTAVMSQTPVATLDSAAIWGDLLTNKILILAATALMLINLLDTMRIFPQLLFCLRRPYGSETLEHSVSLARMRNNTAAVCVIPFCLMVDHAALFRPQLWDMIPAMWSSAATVVLLLAYLALRDIMFSAFRMRRIGLEASGAARHCQWNFFILLCILMLVSCGISVCLGLPATVTRKVYLVEIGLFFLISLLRTSQIFGSHCSGLQTILYLCALEILPAAAIVVCAVLF